jgi:small-conductance mechanosensitive channel
MHKQLLRSFLMVCLAALGSMAVALPLSAAAAGSDAVSLQGVAPADVDSVLAALSDEQVRGLLIEELKRDPALSTQPRTGGGGLIGLVSSMLHVLDGEGEVNLGEFIALETRMARALPAEMDWMLRTFSTSGSRTGAWRNIALVLLVFSGGFFMEFLFRLMTGNVRRQFMGQVVPEFKGVMRFWASLLRVLPSLIFIAVFAVTALLIFVWTPLEQMESLRYLFMALLVTLVGIRSVSALSQLFFSPEHTDLRLAPVSDAAAGRIHGSIQFLSTYIIAAVSFIALAKDVGLQVESLSLIGILLATLLLVLIALVVFINRKSVARAILGDEDEEGAENWLRRVFASIWHVLVLCYILLVWFIMIFQKVQGRDEGGGAFLFSLMLVPTFVVLDRIGLWIVRSIIHTMRIYDPASLPDDENLQEALKDMESRKYRLVRRVQAGVRFMILGAMAAWTLRMWGYPLPYAAAITGAVFDSLVTLTLALMFWRVASGYIERKIQEATPEEEENGEDDEWGAAANRGRSYTLLPMVRKFIGTTLVVMVTLIILSSMGVDIGPLLAGAGVIGLAIGFGAQKLVADVFSGFFYLLDDAFRVGEYMEAGGVSGAVEAITLRNVMLRHHRGMLQIVPYSELGAITNYMRGGIVVKFNLEFPYDTDIDKVRKVIKKVGQAMLKDPEFGEDFIRPVKSQGVREITASVMVIRVKFTAKPGTHFVIRREAYRRITEALAAKGIHYAHRKVIVEMPEEAKAAAAEHPEQAIEAAAGAAMATIEEEEAKKAAGQGTGSGQAMPGM